jgi:hypothetical protein
LFGVDVDEDDNECEMVGFSQWSKPVEPLQNDIHIHPFMSIYLLAYLFACVNIEFSGVVSMHCFRINHELGRVRT